MNRFFSEGIAFRVHEMVQYGRILMYQVGCTQIELLFDLFGRPQTSASPPVIFIAGRPKAALLFLVLW